jgi:hypothetical protein
MVIYGSLLVIKTSLLVLVDVDLLSRLVFPVKVAVVPGELLGFLEFWFVH